MILISQRYYLNPNNIISLSKKDHHILGANLAIDKQIFCNSLGLVDLCGITNKKRKGKV